MEKQTATKVGRRKWFTCACVGSVCACVGKCRVCVHVCAYVGSVECVYVPVWEV